MRAAAFPRPQQPTCPAKITLETSMHAPLVGAALPRPGTVPATAKARKSDKMGKIKDKLLHDSKISVPGFPDDLLSFLTPQHAAVALELTRQPTI